MARKRISGMGALWPWPWWYDLRSWHTLESWTTIVWNIIQIQHISEELWPGQGFWVCVHCDLDLGDMTLCQDHDTVTPLSNGQQLCEILPRLNLAVRSYGPDTDFWYVCTVTLTLEVWPWVKVMTHPLVMDNKCVKYYPDPTLQRYVMAQTRIFSICTLWSWPWSYDLVSIVVHDPRVMTHPWVMDNNCVKCYPDPTLQWGVMALTQILGMCTLWPWPWRYDLESRSWHTLGSLTTIVWNIIQI